MRKLFIASIIFVALYSATAVAQDKTTIRWHRFIPETEAFAVLMPEAPLRVKRVIPFSDKLKVTTRVYEVGHRGILFSALSINKEQVDAFKTSDNFESGLRHAIKHSSRAANSEFIFERKVTLNNQTVRQYLVRAEGTEGTAQVYETATHYYVLMTLGASASELLAGNFFNSFTLDAKSARSASDKVSINRDFSRSSAAPEPLWPVAGSLPVGGVVRGRALPVVPRDAIPTILPPGGATRAAVSGAIGGTGGTDSQSAPSPVATSQTPPPLDISGGVLNGKAVYKITPEYPPVAKAARAQGTVVVQITVDEEGYVISAEAVSGHPLLRQATVQAARQARFTPTLLEGEPVKVAGIVTYNFVFR